MLVLTRKQGESIDIGDDFKVIVLDTPGNAQKIGIIVPKEVKVLWTELKGKKADKLEVDGNRQSSVCQLCSLLAGFGCIRQTA